MKQLVTSAFALLLFTTPVLAQSSAPAPAPAAEQPEQQQQAAPIIVSGEVVQGGEALRTFEPPLPAVVGPIQKLMTDSLRATLRALEGLPVKLKVEPQQQGREQVLAVIEVLEPVFAPAVKTVRGVLGTLGRHLALFTAQGDALLLAPSSAEGLRALVGEFVTLTGRLLREGPRLLIAVIEHALGAVADAAAESAQQQDLDLSPDAGLPLPPAPAQWQQAGASPEQAAAASQDTFATAAQAASATAPEVGAAAQGSAPEQAEQVREEPARGVVGVLAGRVRAFGARIKLKALELAARARATIARLKAEAAAAQQQQLAGQQQAR